MISIINRLKTNGFRHLGLSLVFALATAATLPAHATSPTEFDVTDNTITFSYPDWYQVQDSTNYTTLCEGNTPCTVPNGEYIVINHSINERFIVSVGNQGGPLQLLSWPDDGWYQVQDAGTFETICEGGTSCQVEPGTYIVINHTTGVRTETVVTGTGTTPVIAAISEITVTGSTIRWPNDAWYQVENRQTFEIVCQGGSQCEVPDGVYWVSWFDFDGTGTGGGGTRVIVGTPMDVELDNESFQNTVSVDGNTINWSVDGWYQVQDAFSTATICNGEDQCVVEAGRYIVINHSLGLRTVVDVD